MAAKNGFKQETLSRLAAGRASYEYYDLKKLEKLSGHSVARLPFSMRVMLENQLRCATQEDVEKVLRWNLADPQRSEIPYMPARVVMQDFTGIPAVADMAAMRDTVQKLGGDPGKINPVVETALVIDHSVQVDFFGSPEALDKNVDLEYARNRERYLMLKWSQKAFRNSIVVPPGMGIIHQVNLEYLAKVVMTDKGLLYPDTLVGTDSHTTMINGLGVVGFGVGGIEAEAVMLGQPYSMVLPDVVGVKLTGKLKEGVTATDLVLTVTEVLRKSGVVGKFVEFFGPGIFDLPLPDRATLANMAPEYGATIGFFPVDPETLNYLNLSGRDPGQVELVEKYCREQMLFAGPGQPDPEFSAVVNLDLSGVEGSLAGPKRPQDRVPFHKLKESFRASLLAPVEKRGFAVPADQAAAGVPLKGSGGQKLSHGSVVIAAITSCTNTSNPSVMIGAGLLAKKAVARGLSVKPHVKTSLAPGSQVVTEYLRKTGLLESLEALNFHLVGYGCTTCIGNSGPLPEAVASAVQAGGLVAAAVLSGNRNFEGRINPHVKANYLGSPLHVVAMALAGTVDFDPAKDPLGTDREGRPVYLKEIWPTAREVSDAVRAGITPAMYREKYRTVLDGTEAWQKLSPPDRASFAWDKDSTYIQCPPFFEGLGTRAAEVADIVRAPVLALLGDSVTTDHISPAGTIPAAYPAGLYLKSKGVEPKDFNSYGARRGNHEVMMRGTFANVRLRNLLLDGVEGGYTFYFPESKQMFIYDAAMRYRESGTPLVVLAGKEYGTGSSRDWAAKGTLLLGVRAVIAESFERIHRSNLVGMGVLPLEFLPGESWRSLPLSGKERLTLRGLKDLKPRQKVAVEAESAGGSVRTFQAVARLDSEADADYFRNGGILPKVLRDLLKG